MDDTHTYHKNSCLLATALSTPVWYSYLETKWSSHLLAILITNSYLYARLCSQWCVLHSTTACTSSSHSPIHNRLIYNRHYSTKCTKQDVRCIFCVPSTLRTDHNLM